MIKFAVNPWDGGKQRIGNSGYIKSNPRTTQIKRIFIVYCNTVSNKWRDITYSPKYY